MSGKRKPKLPDPGSPVGPEGAGAGFDTTVTEEGVRLAANLSVAHCAHGVWLRLHDRQGRIFAAAIMPLDTTHTVVEELLDAAGKVVLESTPEEDCGHA